MKKLVVLSLVIVMLVLAACGGQSAKTAEPKPAEPTKAVEQPTKAPEPTKAAAEPTQAPAEAATEYADTLNFYNWSEYIDPEIYDMFEKEYGIKVVESTFASNEDLLAKLQGGATGFDVIVPSDYMVATMIELDMLAPIDHSKLENYKNLDPLFTDPPYDPGLKYSIPYMWGTTGIGYDGAVFGDEVPDSWSYLFDPEVAKNYADQYSLLNDSAEVFAAALKYLGYSANSTDPDEINAARDVILAIKPYVHTFDSEQFEDLLASGEIVMAHGWSGDVFTVMEDNEDIGYVIPKEGGVVWADTLAIPKEVASDPVRYNTALLWIDFLNRPDIAAKNVEYVYYASPNAAATDLIPAEILEDPGIYPPQEVMDRMEWLKPLGDAQKLRDRAWTEIKSQ